MHGHRLRVVESMKRAGVGRRGRTMSSAEIEPLRLRFVAVPDWYWEALTSVPIVGLDFSYSGHATPKATPWSVEWADANGMTREAEAYPGIVAARYGYVPVGLDLSGGGDPFFVRFADGSDPPLVQIFHDSVSDEHGMNERSLRMVAPSLSEFFSQASRATTSDPMDQPYPWYQDLFCRDLGLCVRADQDWGSANPAPDKIGQIARHYLSHPEYSRVGREMLVECLLESASEQMRAASLTAEESDLLLQAVQRAIDDAHDQDAVALYSSQIDRPDDRNPLYHWLRAHLPGWEPRPPVWRTAS